MLVLLSTVFAGSMVTPPSPPLDCETSARWKQLDERVLDREAPTGTSGMTLTIACRFLGLPGALVDLGESSDLSGLEVIGMRRGNGQIIVAVTPEQAVQIEGHAAPLDSKIARRGDWRALIDAMERVPH